MPTPATHICPKCKRLVDASEFLTPNGDRRKWCSPCRAGYRDRLTKLHAKVASKPGEALDVSAIATQEGYQDHPLAQLLALSHIAGAKRALAIRDGKSWRGKKAWRAYYEAKRELNMVLALQKIGNLTDAEAGEMMVGEGDKTDFGP